MTRNSRRVSQSAVEFLPGFFSSVTRRSRSPSCWDWSNRHNSYDRGKSEIRMSNVETMTELVMFKKIRGRQHNHKKYKKSVAPPNSEYRNWNKIQLGSNVA